MNAFLAGRKRHNLSQAELAKKIGVSKQAVSQFERGQNYPSREVLDSLCVTLGLPYDELELKCLKTPTRSGLKLSRRTASST